MKGKKNQGNYTTNGTFWFDLGCILSFGIPKWEAGQRVCVGIDWSAIGDWFASLFDRKGAPSGDPDAASLDDYDIFAQKPPYTGSDPNPYFTLSPIIPPANGGEGPSINIPPPSTPYYHDPVYPFLGDDKNEWVEDDPIIDNGFEIGLISPIVGNVPTRRLGHTTTRPYSGDLDHGTTGDGTGIYFANPSISDNTLFEKMRGLIWTFTFFDNGLRDAGYQMIEKFKDRSGGTFRNATVEDRVSKSSAFINFIKKYQEMLNFRLQQADGNIDLVSDFEIPFRPQFNSRFDKRNGLTILINDTKSTEIYLNNFTINGNLWKARISVVIKDNFGLDRSDAINYQDVSVGFAAWWVLQHQRDYVPFENVVMLSMPIMGQL